MRSQQPKLFNQSRASNEIEQDCCSLLSNSKELLQEKSWLTSNQEENQCSSMHWKPSSRLNTYFDFVFGLNFIMTRIKNIKVASNLKCSQFYVDVSNTQTLLIHSGCTYFPPVINQTPSCICTIKWYLINASCNFPVINQMPSCSRTFGWYLSAISAPAPRLQIILIYERRFMMRRNFKIKMGQTA